MGALTRQITGCIHLPDPDSDLCPMHTAALATA